MANHSCDTGFVMFGNNTRTCTGDGSSTTGVFDGEAAICELICVLPTPPLNGALLTNTDQTESSVITFQCDPGFSLMGTQTTTCNNSGLWDPDPALLECASITGAWNVAALSGGFVAIVIVPIVLVVIFLLVVTIRKIRATKGFLDSPPGDPVYEEVYLAMTNRQLSGNEVPIAPAGPVYEEVDLAMTPRTQDIQVESNEAYGQTAKQNIKLQSNQAYEYTSN
ncbi:complement component receptor 1-like protein [Halichondria panicea]|uniref:complement component receptor 1-like protein n=1 Tax=Halichondria panicea TaxID=6063 RepID=UPI00312BA5B4